MLLLIYLRYGPNQYLLPLHQSVAKKLGTLRSDDAKPAKTSLHKWICVLSVFFAITPTHVLCQRLANPPGVEFLRTIFKFRKRIKVCRRLFTSSLKSKIRQFHFVVLQKRPRNLQKSEMHVQSCCFAYWTCCCLTFSLQSRSGIVKSLLSDTWRATLEIGAA